MPDFNEKVNQVMNNTVTQQYSKYFFCNESVYLDF